MCSSESFSLCLLITRVHIKSPPRDCGYGYSIAVYTVLSWRDRRESSNDRLPINAYTKRWPLHSAESRSPPDRVPLYSRARPRYTFHVGHLYHCRYYLSYRVYLIPLFRSRIYYKRVLTSPVPPSDVFGIFPAENKTITTIIIIIVTIIDRRVLPARIVFARIN